MAERGSFSDSTSISGVGWTAMTKSSGRTPLGLAVHASLAAVADAGLEPGDIDGLVTWFWGLRDTPAPAEVGQALGLTSCHLQACDAGGGSWAASAVAAAASAVHAGFCRNVLVYRASNSRSAPAYLPGLDTWHSGQRQWNEPFGAQHPATIFGPHVSAYLHENGLDASDQAPLAVLQRTNAGLNTKALMTAPMTIEDHQASPWIVDPFRLLDCSVWNDGAMALVVSATDETLRRKGAAVTVRGVRGGGLGAPVRRRGALRHWQLTASVLVPELLLDAGIGVGDLDLAQVYDPFSGMAMLHLEEAGLTSPGSTADRIRHGELDLDGPMPVNTHGGHLSEGTTAGLGHVVEAVQQLAPGGVRDDHCAGDHDFNRRRCRQVRDPEFGLVLGESGDSGLVLRRVQ